MSQVNEGQNSTTIPNKCRSCGYNDVVLSDDKWGNLCPRCVDNMEAAEDATWD